MESHLELENVRKAYGRVVAVEDLSFSIPRGSVFGLLGPNGAGKTTTIRVIMRITLADGGSIRLAGQLVTDLLRERIGYLPEERGLYRKMRAIDHLVFLAEVRGLPRGEARKRAAAWLERLGLAERARQKVEELSKGMQQKVQFAGAVIHEPELVILDEPFAGLDPIATRLLKDVIDEMGRHGTTVLLSTHVLPQAEELCDHLCLINRGRSILHGSMAELRAHHARPALRVETNAAPGELAGIGGVTEARSHDGAVSVTLADGAREEDVIRALVQRVEVRSVTPYRASLEDIFLRAVEGDHAAVA